VPLDFRSFAKSLAIFGGQRLGEARVKMVTGFHRSGVDAIRKLDERNGALRDGVRRGWRTLGYVLRGRRYILRGRRILGDGQQAEQSYGDCAQAYAADGKGRARHRDPPGIRNSDCRLDGGRAEIAA
jgi:hypothetical protein